MLHPLTVGSVLLLAVNDHWGKHHLAPALAGKLSDVAGLVFFPVFAVSLAEVAAAAMRCRMPGSKFRLLTIAATGAAFTAMKTWAPATAAYDWCLGAVQWLVAGPWHLADGDPWGSLHRVRLVADASDLFALPALLAAWWILGQVRRRRRQLPAGEEIKQLGG